jgi:hypothetical protein
MTATTDLAAAAVELVRHTTRAQGLPERVEDDAVLEQIAMLLGQNKENAPDWGRNPDALANTTPGHRSNVRARTG